MSETHHHHTMSAWGATEISQPKKRRAAIACSSCHSRKVRCNVVLVGLPCTNCQQDEAACVLHVSTRGKHKRRKPDHLHHQTPAEDSSAPSASGPGVSGVLFSSPPAWSVVPEDHPDLALTRSSVVESTTSPASEFPPPPSSSQDDEFDSPSNVDAYRAIVDPPETDEVRVPMYVGELQSLRLIFHVAHDKSIASKTHFLLPQPKRRQLSPEEIACLEAKGAFCLESEEVRAELLALFFDYVYPILPIVDPVDFYRRYDAGGASSVSPLLLQTMFLAASNFISVAGLRRSALPSRLALKRRFYERAKALYDFEYETDKICLIQSVLLMGYWLGHAHDRTDSWHWVGVAISLSQSVGLHRDPGSSNVPASQRRLWRRIWWCCFYRDRSIALGMGRTHRINAEHCDVQELTSTDLVSNTGNLMMMMKPESVAVVDRCNGYAPMFLEIVQLSRLLGDVLSSVYRPRPRSRPETPPLRELWEAVERLDERLKTWSRELDPRCRIDNDTGSNTEESVASALHRHYIHIFYHVIVITLYKPFIFQGGLSPTNPNSDSRARVAWERALLSATAATASFRKLSELELIRVLSPESVTMLISILAILFLSKCLLVTSGGGGGNNMRWHLASQNLDLAMLVLHELQEKYLAARFVFAYYTAAFEKVAPPPPPPFEEVDESPHNSTSSNGITTRHLGGTEGAATAVGGSPSFDFSWEMDEDEDCLGTCWADLFSPGLSSDYDLLFGADGIIKGLGVQSDFS